LNNAILDTDTLSEIGKPKNSAVVANAQSYRRAFDDYTLSVITVMEIVRGVQQPHALTRLNASLATLPHM